MTDLTPTQLAALDLTARGLGYMVNHATRTQLDALGLIEHGAPDGWPYWHCTPAGFRTLAGDTDPNEPDDYCDQIADAWKDDEVQ